MTTGPQSSRQATRSAGAKPRLPVFVYHQVAPDLPDRHHSLFMSPDLFERQIKWLAKQGFTAIRPSDWLAWRREGIPLPRKPVLLTFDDGFAATAEHAFPILRRYGFTAAVFVVTGHIGGQNEWDEGIGWGPHKLMTAEQIRKWAAEGIEFGAHSRTHPDMRELDPPRLEEEVKGSRDELAAIVGAPVTSFAYPYGLYIETTQDCVRQNFGLAFGVRPGVNNRTTDLHCLKRTLPQWNDTSRDLMSRVVLGWSWAEAVLWLGYRSSRLLRRAKA